MADQKINVGVLETGRPPEELASEHGDYPSMVSSWLSGLDAAFSSFAILDGEFPNSPKDCDLWVITGSKFGAYEDHPWIPPLEEFIRSVRKAGGLMFGICFGHQLIAQALGGTVRKSDKGWGLGVHEYDTTNWPQELGEAPEGIAIQAFHQDQVEALPDGAKSIASSDFCEHAALWYPGFALTVQGHPEFSKSYASALIKSRRGTVLQEEDADHGQASMVHDTNRDVLARMIHNYMLHKPRQLNG